MAGPGTPPPAGSQIPYWGTYLNSFGQSSDPSQTPQGQQFLTSLQKYDPTAKWTEQQNSNEGGQQPDTWQLQYNPKDIPGIPVNSAGVMAPSMQPVDLNSGQTSPAYLNYAAYSPNANQNIEGGGTNQSIPSYSNQPADISINATNQLINPNLTANNGPLGKYTVSANIKNQDTGVMGFLGKYMPYVVGATLAYGGGLAGASALGGAGLGLGSMGSTIGNALGKFGVNEMMSGGQANPLSAAMSLVPGIAGSIPGVSNFVQSTGVGSVLPYLGAAQALYGASQGNPNSIFSLAKLGYGSLGGK